MSQYKDTNTVTMTASAAISQYALVHLASTGKVASNGLAEVPVGVAMTAAFADGDLIEVKLLNASGTFPGLAVEALAIGATLYTEASGKLQDTAETTSLPIGISMAAATGDGDVIEWVPLPYGGPAAS